LGILIGGAEVLVRGAASISKKAGISSMVVGLTVVAFGTSAPELIVNIFSALKGSTDLAVGNIVGSGIANILLILGVSAAIVTLEVKSNTTWKEIPFAALAVIAVYIMANDKLLDKGLVNAITRSEGLILLGFFVVFMYYVFGLMKASPISDEDSEIKIYKSLYSFSMVVGGILGLFFGGKLLVDNATLLARSLGMSEILIGLTVVAVGTSLPELATSVIAATKKQTDIAIGNIIGSNIFNIFWILGLTSTIRPISISEVANFDIIVNLVITVLLFVILALNKHKLKRPYGYGFLIIYVLYITFTFLRG
jgi:cation:H+ antiporter